MDCKENAGNDVKMKKFSQKRTRKIKLEGQKELKKKKMIENRKQN